MDQMPSSPPWVRGSGWWDTTEEPTVMRCVDLFERMVTEEDPAAGARVELSDEGSHFHCKTYCRHHHSNTFMGTDDILPSIEDNAYAHDGGSACSAFLMRRVFAYREALSRCALDIDSDQA